MKKILKWIFKIFLIFFGLIIILLIVIPKFYKDEILTKVKEEINNNVNAKVEFTDFKLSMFKTFPDLNIGLYELSIAGINQFEGDTLVYFESFNIQVNLISAIKKNVIVKGLILNEPFINGKVLADSTVNWDIAKPIEEIDDTIRVEEEVALEDSDSETMDYRVDLKKFQIKNAKIIYTDQTSEMKASLENLNFLLKGDFGMDYSDLSIKTSIDAINVKMGAIKYLKNASFGFDATIGADLENMVYTFKDNLFSLNDIALGFDGVIKMIDEDIEIDVLFGTKKTSFKSLLSMVPAIYMEGFEDLETTGNLILSGDVKGTYNESQMPLANIKLLVENARIQYPDLPKAVENINIDFTVFYDGVVNDNTKVDLNKFHLEMANNPFDISMHLKTPFSDPYIEAMFDGHIILNTLADALPLDNMNLNGEIIADVDIAGNMSTIENENYEDFNATGQLQLKDFEYESDDLPAVVKIIETTFNFTPQFLELKSFDSKVGESDFHLNGKIENYIPYVLSDGTLRGDFKFTSSYINVNEFLTETEEAKETDVVVDEPADSATVATVFEVPENIDFKLVSSLDHVLYDKIDINNLTGTFLIKDKKVLMDNLNMKILDGEIGIDGEYNTQKIEEPTVIMGLDIRDIEIESAVNSFSMIEKMAPILKDCKGKVSIKFDFKSLLDSEMSPVLNSIDGYGKLKSEKIEVVSSKTLDQLGKLLKMADKFDNEFKDINISFKVNDGRITVEPFDVKVSEINMTVAGSHGIDQTLDYNLNLLVPRKYFGSAANDALDGLLKEAAAKGVKLDVSENINVKAKVIGTSTDPKITLNYKDDTGNAEQGLKEELKKKADAEARAEVEAQAQKVIDDAEVEAAKIKKDAREAADKLIADGNKEADALVAKAAKEGYLAKVAAETAAKEAKKEAQKQADALVNEANKKADGIVETARIEADKIRREK